MEAKMLKRLIITTAAAALMTGTAFAQAPAPAPSTEGVATLGEKHFVTEQKADQFLASKFKGTDVMGTNNEKIGDVSDILFDKDGKILAYVISVGGFLGIGAKDVALAPMAFQIQPASDRDSMKLKLAMTKDELKQAADFKPYKEATRTVGEQGSPTTGMVPRTPPARPTPPLGQPQP